MAELIEGITVSVIGIGITFLIMFILIMFINLFKCIISKTPQNKAVISAETVLQTEQDFEQDKEITAAITAAVACFMHSEGKTENDFIVRKIRKIF